MILEAVYIVMSKKRLRGLLVNVRAWNEIFLNYQKRKQHSSDSWESFPVPVHERLGKFIRPRGRGDWKWRFKMSSDLSKKI